MACARGRLVSRPGVAVETLCSGSGWRISPPKPSSARISATEVRFSGVRSAYSRAEISYVDSPSRRNSTTRPRARSLACAEPGGGPGLFGGGQRGDDLADG